MPDDINALRAKYLRSEAERLRLRLLNSALRKQIDDSRKQNDTGLSPLPPSFLPPNEKQPRDNPDNGGLWKNFASSNAGINKRYRIYIGYLHEQMGWRVDYSCGKILVSRKNNRIIAALTESAATVDLENIYSLLGAAMELKRDNGSKLVSAMCITSSALISRVKNLAQKFSITIRKQFYFRNFPCVKCKADIDGQRAYYVPDDEEYLSVRVIPSEGDKFCWTAGEAESQDFYRPL